MFGKIFASSHSDAGSGIGRLALRLLTDITVFARVMRHRREVMRLAELDDRTLKDIGLLRSDVAGALAESYGTDPSRILVTRRHERRTIARPSAVQARPSVVPRVRPR